MSQNPKPLVLRKETETKRLRRIKLAERGPFVPRTSPPVVVRRLYGAKESPVK